LSFGISRTSTFAAKNASTDLSNAAFASPRRPLFRVDDATESASNLDRLNTTVHVQFLVDIVEMTLGGSGRNEDLVADFVIRETLRDKLENFDLSFTQRIVEIPPGQVRVLSFDL
jgi:hypothetical protein